METFKHKTADYRAEPGSEVGIFVHKSPPIVLKLSKPGFDLEVYLIENAGKFFSAHSLTLKNDEGNRIGTNSSTFLASADLPGEAIRDSIDALVEVLSRRTAPEGIEENVIAPILTAKEEIPTGTAGFSAFVETQKPKKKPKAVSVGKEKKETVKKSASEREIPPKYDPGTD